MSDLISRSKLIEEIMATTTRSIQGGTGMTVEEAHKILHPDTTLLALCEIEYYAGFGAENARLKAVDEACIVACEALEKQIPREPHPYIAFDGIERNGCPRCFEELGRNEILYAGQRFCSVCGQAIKRN